MMTSKQYLENLQGMLEDAHQLHDLAMGKGNTAKVRFYSDRVAEHKAELEKLNA